MLFRAAAAGQMPLQELNISGHQSIGCEALQTIGELLPALVDLKHVYLSSYDFWRNDQEDHARTKASRVLVDGLKRALRLKQFVVHDEALDPSLQRDIFLLRSTHPVWSFVF
jgi:hypothetical protein